MEANLNIATRCNCYSTAIVWPRGGLSGATNADLSPAIAQCLGHSWCVGTPKLGHVSMFCNLKHKMAIMGPQIILWIFPKFKDKTQRTFAFTQIGL